MPINNRLQGLKGISAINHLGKSFNQLSADEQQRFIDSHRAELAPYLNSSIGAQVVSDFYDNRRFVDTFGKKAFLSLDDGSENALNYRNKLLNQEVTNRRNNLIINTFKSSFENNVGKFGKYGYNDLVSGLDTQGMYDLLKNTNYLSNSEGLQKIKKEEDYLKETTAGGSHAFIPSAAQWQIDNQRTPVQVMKNITDTNNSIIDKLFAETQKRRENSVSGISNALYENMLKANDAGSKTLAQSYKDFDKLMDKSSNFYAQFKNSEWLKDYSNDDRLKDYAKYLALANTYGKGLALDYFNRSIQNRVAKAQDGKWTGNTLNKAVNTMISDLGSQVAMINGYAGKAKFDIDKIGLLNQGLDPDDPIYAKDKNDKILRDKYGKPIIVGYHENKNIWSNPGYWNDVYMYNTRDQNEIALIKQRGGISPYVNVHEYGYNPNEHILSWDTAREGFAQSGHLAASLLETAVLGGIGKGIGYVAGNGLRALGVGAETLGKISKVGSNAHNLLLEGIASMNGPQGEAMGTFNEQLENNKEAIDNQIKNELHNYYKTIDYNSKEAQNAIRNYYKKLKANDQRRVSQGTLDTGIRQLPLSDKTLMEQAKQAYTDSLLNAKEKELTISHQKALAQANRNAAETYITNWIMDYAKETALTHAIQKFKVSKGATAGSLDNSIAKDLIADAETHGVKRAAANAAKNFSWKKMAKATGKQVWGGFQDEYLDGLNADFSEAMGSHMFKNYLDKNYNPKDYNATMDTMLGNMLAGMDGFMNGMADRENIYEGAIGAISPFVSGSIGAGAVFHPEDTYNALVKGVDEKGKPINIAERISNVFTNPLLDEYARMKAKDRDVQAHEDAINKVVKQYVDNGGITDISRLVSAMNNYSSPMKNRLYQSKNGEHISPLLDSEDNKLHNVFTLADVLDHLNKIEGGAQSQLYQDIMGNMKGLAEGNLSDEEMNAEIDKFLADEDNKSIMDQPNGREIAADRLQKNAKYFMNLLDKKHKIEETFDKSPSFKNMDEGVKTMMKYNLLAEDDYKERLKSIEDNLGTSHTDTDNEYTPNLGMRYPNQNARNNALKARDRRISDLNESKQEAEQSIQDSVDKIHSLENRLGEDHSGISTKIEQEQNILKAKNMVLDNINENIEKAKAEKKVLEENLKNNPASQEFTEDIINNLDARDRAFLFDENNQGNFTKEQQKVIQRAKEDLERKDPDAITKIHDAGTLAVRISDLKEMYSKIKSNDKLAADFIASQDLKRKREAIMESQQQALDHNYAILENLYDTNKDEFDNAWLSSPNINSTFAELYMQDHPEQADRVKPYYEILKFNDDARAIIDNDENEEDEAVKQNRKENLFMLQQGAKSKDEVIQRIEQLIDNDKTPADAKAYYNDLLDKTEKLGYQRDQTVLESRKERLKREAEAKAKADAEAIVKAEEEAKRVAEEAASNNQEGLSEEDKKKAAEVANATPKQEVPDNAAETVGAEQNGETMPVSWTNSLMDNNAEEGSASAGEMWHRTEAGPRKEVVTVNLKVGDNGKRTITFTNGNQNEEIVVSPKDYVVKASAQQKPTEQNNNSVQKSSTTIKDIKGFKIDNNGHFTLDSSVTIDDLKNLKDFDKYFEVTSSEAPLQESTDFDLISDGDFGRADNDGNRPVRRKAKIQLRGKETGNSAQQSSTEPSNKEQRKEVIDRSKFTIPISPINNESNLAGSHSLGGASLLADKEGNFIPHKTDINNLRIMPALHKFFDFKDNEASMKEATGFEILSSGKFEDVETDDGKTTFKKVTKKGVIKLLGKDSSNTQVSNQTVNNVQENNAQQKVKESVNSKESAVKVAENRPFHAKSLEKESEDWYFVGNFEGDNKETRVKASKDFNLDMAINEQRAQREKLYAKQGNTMEVQLEEDSDGNISASNPTLEDQENNMPDNMKGTIIEESSMDSDVQANVRGEEQQDNSATQLSGYPMAIWSRESLQGNERALVRDKDTKSPYSRDKLNVWLDSRGIHLRDIIDHELADILNANPHTKVKFMATNFKDFPATREHKDYTVSNNLFMVLDYDNNINKGITQIHNDSNGGVIETADGKKYLIIGVFAYKNGNTAQQALYNNLWGAATNGDAGVETKKRKQKAFGVDDPRAKDGFGMIRNERDAYFPHHTKEVFYVSPNFSTEIVPYSLIPGWNVHKMEGDTEAQYRPVIELMNDEKRNPYHITLDNASWAIQEQNKFLIVSPKGTEQERMSVMAPSNTEKNLGATFILFPAANGKMFCGHINACMYKDMKEGSLKEKADKYLNDLMSSDYETRVNGIKGLYHIFYFNNEKNKGKKILTNRRGQITFKRADETVFDTFILGESFDRVHFIQRFIDFQPRVNITAWVLGNKNAIKEYSEAGALNTDLAQLALAGSSYSVYSVNVDGTINKPIEAVTPVTKSQENKFRESSYDHITYYTDGKVTWYDYNKTDGKFYLNGDEVTDENLIKQLEYNRQVTYGNITYETEENGYKYYIIRDTDNPLVIKINNNYQVTELSPEDSRAYIDKVNKDKEAKARDKAAQQVLSNMEGSEDVNLGIDTELLPSISSHQGEYKGEYIDSIDNDGTHHLEYNGMRGGQRKLTSKILDDSGYLIEEVLDTDIDEIKKLNSDKDSSSKITKEDVLDSFTYENSWDIDSVIIHSNGDIDLVVGNGIKAYIKGDIAKELANKLFPELKNKDTNNTYPTGSGLVYNPETGGLLDIAKQEKQKREEEELKKKEEELKKKDEERKNLPKDSITQSTTQTFEELIKNTMYYDKIKDIINKKSKEEGWGKVPKNPKKLAEYLQKHGVEVMSIGTSKEDIETWIDTLENCK